VSWGDVRCRPDPPRRLFIRRHIETSARVGLSCFEPETLDIDDNESIHTVRSVLREGVSPMCDTVGP